MQPVFYVAKMPSMIQTMLGQQGYCRIRRWSSLLLALLLSNSAVSSVQAQESTGSEWRGTTTQTQPPPDPDKFPANPLELKAPDPLLPRFPVAPPLSALERQQLETNLDQLNTQATTQLKLGNRLGAFDIWNRELRLRRVLGALSEVQALGRVGDVAWRENQPNQVRIITKRLQEVQQQAETQPTLDILLFEALGLAYQQVRSPGQAVTAYERILTDARQRQDRVKEIATLNTIGELHLSWFDYAKAEVAYQNLLAIAQAAGDRPNQVLYLKQLAFVYEQAKKPAQAIPVQKQLIGLYQTPQEAILIPAVKVKIADNYQLLGQLAEAEQHYKEAYTLSQPLQQLAYASEALQKLGVLYRSHNRLDAALQVYEFLVGVEQQAYNVYGMMDAFDQIGQISVAQKAYPQAIAAFQKGFALAQQIKYRQDYFAAQIKQLSRPSPQ